jgi:hypothetical protein
LPIALDAGFAKAAHEVVAAGSVRLRGLPPPAKARVAMKE